MSPFFDILLPISIERFQTCEPLLAPRGMDGRKAHDKRSGLVAHRGVAVPMAVDTDQRPAPPRFVTSTVQLSNMLSKA